MPNTTIRNANPTAAKKSETTHTQGPLEVGYYTPTPKFLNAREHVAVMKPSGALIAVTGPVGEYVDKNDSSHADARLFAAAADLLKACEAVEADLGPYYDNSNRDTRAALDLVRAAIAKATGGAR